VRDFKPTAWLVLLFVADTLFLWMFFASAGFERMFEANSAAHDFAARWRHGMNGGCPLYMPGYFATALTTWFWSSGRRLRSLLVEGIVILFLSVSVAALLAPLGAEHLVEFFRQQSHLQALGVLMGTTAAGTIRGIFTLVAWSVLIIAGQRALVRGSLLPLLLPLVLGVVLALVRPVATFHAMVALWGERVLQGDGAAIFSLLAIPGAAAFLVWKALSEKRLNNRLREKDR